MEPTPSLNVRNGYDSDSPGAHIQQIALVRLATLTSCAFKCVTWPPTEGGRPRNPNRKSPRGTRRSHAIITMNIRDFAGASETHGLRILQPGDLVAELRKERR